MATLPTSGINTTLVKSTLGENNNKVSLLCKSTSINLWSRRKPVQDSRIEIPLSEVGLSSDGNWGLDIPSWAGDDSLLTTYTKPTSKFRLGDFRGYTHTATIPVNNGPAPEFFRSGPEFIVVLIAQSGGDNVSIYDIAGNGLRPGVEVYNSSGTPINAASAEDGESSILIDLSGLANQTLTFKFGLVDYYKPWSNTGGLNFLYELPRKDTTENQNWVVPIISQTAPVPGETEDATYISGNFNYILNDGIAGNGYLLVRHDRDRLLKWYDLGVTQFKVDIHIGWNQDINNETPLFTVNYNKTDIESSSQYDPVDDADITFIDETPPQNLIPSTNYTMAVFFNYNSTWKLFGVYEFTTFSDPDSGGGL